MRGLYFFKETVLYFSIIFNSIMLLAMLGTELFPSLKAGKYKVFVFLFYFQILFDFCLLTLLLVGLVHACNFYIEDCFKISLGIMDGKNIYRTKTAEKVGRHCCTL